MHFSFHLLETSVPTAVRLLLQRWSRAWPTGMLHREPMAAMELATPIVSTRRFRPGRVALLAVWESFDALDAWLADDAVGRRWAQGWHVRLEFLRRWGHVAALDGLPERAGHHEPWDPVVAVTLARLKLPQVPRFVRGGAPSRPRCATTRGRCSRSPPEPRPGRCRRSRCGAAHRPWPTWSRGAPAAPGARRHVEAMVERRRARFHLEFTTLRFRCLEEHGSWQGRTGIVPTEPPPRGDTLPAKPHPTTGPTDRSAGGPSGINRPPALPRAGASARA